MARWTSNTKNKRAILVGAGVLVASPIQAASFAPAARATNEFGIDLYRKVTGDDRNVCLSPYSISCALAMAWDGADGETRREMARVLHRNPESVDNSSFAALDASLGEIGPKTARLTANSKQKGGPSEPILIAVANRLFAQTGYKFRSQFFARVEENFGTAPEVLDFAHQARAATKKINDWVAKQTRDRVRNLIPQPLGSDTRMVLANALYLKAPWASEFSAEATTPVPFHIRGQAPVDVPTMAKVMRLRYAKRRGFLAVALPYSGDALQFVVLIPDEVDGLPGIEKQLTADLLADCAKMNTSEVRLHLPKFKFEPPTIQLSAELESLGMKTAFDIPTGSANFERMAPRRPNDYLAISEVFHKTFIALDENGTEAAAATAVAMVRATAMRPMTPPVEVKVDRPFFYAIQHVSSGVCLFLGHISDPR